MARHVKTIEQHDDKNRTWVFYDVSIAELMEMVRWVSKNFGKNVEIGDMTQVSLLDKEAYRQAFIFSKRDDAMRFKLSW